MGLEEFWGSRQRNRYKINCVERMGFDGNFDKGSFPRVKKVSFMLTLVI